MLIGPSITTNSSGRVKIESNPKVYGTFVTSKNTPTFQVIETNVDFGDHAVELEGAVRTGGTSAEVGKPLILKYNRNLTVPIGGDLGIIEPARKP